MLQYLFIGIVFSGLLTLEPALRMIPDVGPWIPDLGLLVIIVYGIRGKGRTFTGLIFLLGLIKGCGSGTPAGVFIITYLMIILLLRGTRGFLFTERIFTQVVLTAGSLSLAWVAYSLFIRFGIMSGLHQAQAAQWITSGATTALLVPVFVSIFNRMDSFNKLLHP